MNIEKLYVSSYYLFVVGFFLLVGCLAAMALVEEMPAEVESWLSLGVAVGTIAAILGFFPNRILKGRVLAQRLRSRR